MIRLIAALDNHNGIASEQGIPWDLPLDKAYFRNNTQHGIILMGYGTYMEFDHPLHDRQNFVATTKPESLRPGFEKITDAHEFLNVATQDIWVIGGAGLFASTLDQADELYITHLQADFKCTKFFPDFTHRGFELITKSPPQTENNITYHYEVWNRAKNV